jgi:hypothetical protein
MKRDRMKTRIMLGAFVACCIAAAAPSEAAMPSFASYFSGSWSCTSQLGSTIVKVYGSAPRADALVLINVYDTVDGYSQLFNETYTEKSGTATVISEQPLSGNIYVATSPGFTGNSLVFNGTISGIVGPFFQRMTYTRTDADHFTRTFEVGQDAKSVRTNSTESCTRIAAKPVPTPIPRPARASG